MAAEIVKDDLTFEAISRVGTIVDSGVIHRQARPAPGKVGQ